MVVLIQLEMIDQVIKVSALCTLMYTGVTSEARVLWVYRLKRLRLTYD